MKNKTSSTPDACKFFTITFPSSLPSDHTTAKTKQYVPDSPKTQIHSNRRASNRTSVHEHRNNSTRLNQYDSSHSVPIQSPVQFIPATESLIVLQWEPNRTERVHTL